MLKSVFYATTMMNNYESSARQNGARQEEKAQNLFRGISFISKQTMSVNLLLPKGCYLNYAKFTVSNRIYN